MQDLGLSHLWTQGDFVMRATAIILLIMSLLSWIVILTKTWDLVRLKKMANGAEKRFWHSDDFDHALDTLGANDANPFRALAITGREAAQLHRASQPQLHDALDMSDWLTRSLKNAIDGAVARMQSGLAVLASVGSTAPFVGLFGTVWGIYHALIGMGASGVPTIDKVAGPVGEALIMTAFGLAVVDGDDEAVISQINMTPLVDVMLVLLIIFIITIPVINQAVKIDLPRATNQPNDSKPQDINISIDAQGKVYWNQQEVDMATLDQRIAEATRHQLQPELHLRADRNVRYGRVAQVVAAAHHGGLGKIGFITEPKH